MTRQGLRGGVGAFGGWVRSALAAAVVSWGLFGAAHPPAVLAQDEGGLQAQLAAGEFAPAVRAAQAAGAQERDQILGQVAKAQAQAGLRGAALDTSRDIRNDLTRNQALGDMRGAVPPGLAGFGGGVPAPDFDSLIDLITSTIAPQSWDEVGGPGTIEPFRLGVTVDAQGFVERNLTEESDDRLTRVRDSFARPAANSQVRRNSPMRKVSLNRLEREVQLRLAAGQPLDEEMRLLAGMQRVKYVLLYPETGDVVLAGPAGDWRTDVAGHVVGVESNHPVMRLDDLVVILRHRRDNPRADFGCSIEPRADALARAKEHLDESAKKPLKPGKKERDKWLGRLAEAMGQQDIVFDGVDPATRVARVMFEADYRMKLVGIGLEDGVLKVPSYFDLVQGAKGSPPPLGVLRWWFTINYQSLVASPNRDVFEFHGQGVKCMSENPRLDKDGHHLPTGEATPLNQEFAQNFTRHFGELAEKYPIYAELQNVFDLALAAALIQSEDLPGKADWHMTCFGDPEQYVVAREHAPATVQTVINHRIVEKGKIMAAASGGVTVNPSSLVQTSAIKVEKTNRLESEYRRGQPENIARTAWWWD